LPEPVKPGAVTAGGSETNLGFTVEEPITGASLCFLMEPAPRVPEKENDEKQKGQGRDTEVIIYVNEKKVAAEVEQQTDRWAWYRVKLDGAPGRYNARIRIRSPRQKQEWDGKISAWMVYNIKPGAAGIRFRLARELSKRRPMPPLPYPVGEDKRTVKLGEVRSLK